MQELYVITLVNMLIYIGYILHFTHQYNSYLGYLLHHGKDLEHDRTAAKQWYQQACDEGEGRAAYELGMMALEEDDDQEARKRFDQGVSARHAGCIRQFALVLERDQRDDLHWDGHDVMEWLEDAARLGDIEALMHLGRAYEHGLGKDYPSGQLRAALQFYVAAAQQGHVRAMVKAGDLYSRTGRHYDAVSFFKKAAPKDLTARVMLASYRLQGKGGMQQDGSFVYLESLVREALLNMDDLLRNEEDKHGMGLALFLLGQCYEVGKDPAPLDLETAKKWYTVAVNVASHAEAMYRLGLICSLQENDEASLDWYRMAAEKGRLREAQYQVGLFHKEGRGGLEPNITAAGNYFTKAADQGHPRAKYELAHILWRKGDHQKAFHLYDVAAKLMVPEAMRALGNIYHQGFNDGNTSSSSSRYSIPRDYARAFTLFCEAAKLGDAVAALMVGTYFQEGYWINSDNRMVIQVVNNNSNLNFTLALIMIRHSNGMRWRISLAVDHWLKLLLAVSNIPRLPILKVNHGKMLKIYVKKLILGFVVHQVPWHLRHNTLQSWLLFIIFMVGDVLNMILAKDFDYYMKWLMQVAPRLMWSWQSAMKKESVLSKTWFKL